MQMVDDNSGAPVQSGLARAMAAVDLSFERTEFKPRKISNQGPFKIENYHIPKDEPFGLWSVAGPSFFKMDKKQRPRVHVPVVCQCGKEDNIRYYELIGNVSTGCKPCVKALKKLGKGATNE